MVVAKQAAITVAHTAHNWQRTPITKISCHMQQ
jgi:hypothetical protein